MMTQRCLLHAARLLAYFLRTPVISLGINRNGRRRGTGVWTFQAPESFTDATRRVRFSFSPSLTERKREGEGGRAKFLRGFCDRVPVPWRTLVRKMIKSAKRFVIKEKYTRSRYVIYFCNLTFELSARYAEVHNRAVAIQFARFLLLAFFRESDEDSRKNMYEK